MNIKELFDRIYELLSNNENLYSINLYNESNYIEVKSKKNVYLIKPNDYSIIKLNQYNMDISIYKNDSLSYTLEWLLNEVNR